MITESWEMMKVKIDQTACVGCGQCQILCPEIFETREDGKAHVRKSEVRGGECMFDEVVDNCPAKSISIE